MRTPSQNSDFNPFLSDTDSSMPRLQSLSIADTEFENDAVSAFLSGSPECSKDMEWMNNPHFSSSAAPTLHSSKDEQQDCTDNDTVVPEIGGGGRDELTGDLLPVVEVGDNDGIVDTHRVVMKQKKRISPAKKKTAIEMFGLEDLKLHFGKSRLEAANSLGVSVSTLKRIREKCGIASWPKNKKKKQLCGEINSIDEMQPYPVPGELSTVIAKVHYRDNIIKFAISSVSKLADLQDEISKRLNLKDGSFDIKYTDEDGDWILIRKDEDLWLGMKTLETPKVKMLVVPCSD